MIRPPRFWQKPNSRVLPFLLTPFSKIVGAVAARRMKQKGWVAPVPVLCCGNLTTGGTGKTTVVLDLMARLQTQGVEVHALIRGYKGHITVATRVDPQHHTVHDVGDEALLLAACGPTWVGSNRAASANKAIQAGAQCLIMDDGFQNPTLFKTFSLLIIDGAVGLGNGCVLPAGPLRETAARAFQRADAVLVIGNDRTNFLTRYGSFLSHIQVVHAQLQTHMPATKYKNSEQSYIAFAGLGRPDKFFNGLKQAKISVSKTLAFPDHHCYKQADLEKLSTLAERYKARLLTTAKDAVRLPKSFRQNVSVAGVSLIWADERVPLFLLQNLMGSKT